jgi:hypothetical protein
MSREIEWWVNEEPGDDLHRAIHQSLLGIPNTLANTPREDSDEYLSLDELRNFLQKRIDERVAAVNTPEYASFITTLREILAGVTGQQFAFDLEQTLMDYYEHVGPYSEKPTRIYYLFPWVRDFILLLTELDNEVLFYTSANSVGLKPILLALHPDPVLSKIRIIGNDEVVLVAKKCREVALGEATMDELATLLTSLVPTAGIEQAEEAMRVLSTELGAAICSNPQVIQQLFFKAPSIFVGNNGYIIDNEERCITSAIDAGLNPSHALHFRYEIRNLGIIPEEITRIAEAIRLEESKGSKSS